MPSMPEEGSPAPDFTLPTEDGDVSLADYKGRKLVLYFYPRDLTPGCTTEAIDFSAHKKAFADVGADILGVSKDTVAKHGKFREKHDLTIALGADETGKAVEDYGVWVEKTMYGKKSMGIQRATFLIDGDGIVQKAWPKVKVKGHAEEVLAAVREL